MSRAQLPRITSKHLRVLEIRNETSYATRAIRTLVVRCLRALALKVRGCVRVTYSTVGEHHGVAALGAQIKRSENAATSEASGYITRAGLNMTLTLPRDPKDFVRDQFARVLHHEALHWKGVHHEDMTENQLRCSGAAPEWCADVEVAFVSRQAVSAEVAREKKLSHAREMLARAERKLKLATTIETRWRRRVAAAERAVARAAELKVAAEKKLAAAESGETVTGLPMAIAIEENAA